TANSLHNGKDSAEKSASLKEKRHLCGTIFYNSCEALQGFHSQASDAYSLGLTFFALFEDCDPFVQMPIFRNLSKKSTSEIVKTLIGVIKSDLRQKLHNSPLFKTLKTIEGGKFKPVYSCLNEIFEGLIKVDIDERMSVHEACERVQSIKPLLPKIGEGWKCPSIDDIVKVQLAKHNGDPGCIVEGLDPESSFHIPLPGMELSDNWDQSSRTTVSKEERKIQTQWKMKIRKFETDQEQLEAEDPQRVVNNLKILICSLNIVSFQPQSEILLLYDDKFPLLKAIYDEYDGYPTLSAKIISNQNLFILWFQCLVLFMNYEKKSVTKSSRDQERKEEKFFNSLIESFLAPMLDVESVLRDIVPEQKQDISDFYEKEVDGFEESEEDKAQYLLSKCETKECDQYVSYPMHALFHIVNIAIENSPYLRAFVYGKISPLLIKILDLGQEKKIIFTNSFVKEFLEVLRSIAYDRNDKTKDSVLSLLKPYFLPWMTKYSADMLFESWICLVKNITNDQKNLDPHKDRSSKMWFVFYSVLNLLKKSISDDSRYVENNIEKFRAFRVFSNLSIIPSQAIEIYDNLKDYLLDFCLGIAKQGGNKNVRMYWAQLISVFSYTPELVPLISPKYDADMTWCSTNGAWGSDCELYFKNCEVLSKWNKLKDDIHKSSEISIMSTLYYQHRAEILRLFESFQTRNEIKTNKLEIGQCYQCLQLFGTNNIFFSIPDLNDLIDTFIDHLSRVEEVLESDVDEKYCCICAGYTFKVEDKLDSFLPKISPTFQRILERGSKKKLGGDVVLHLLMTLRNISNSPSFSTRSSILTLIKPYIKDWLRIYNDSECYGEWMIVLSNITLSSDDSTPNKSLCSEAWPLFHPVLDVVKREFEGEKIVEDDHEECLRFFSNLCCDPSHSLEIFDNVKGLLDGWFTVIKMKGYKTGANLLGRFISILSTVPSIVHQLSPQCDDYMEWCNNNCICKDYHSLYFDKCYPFIKSLSICETSIKKCHNIDSKSKVFHKYKECFSLVLSRDRKLIRGHRIEEIIRCFKCLSLFVRHQNSSKYISLPFHDLNDLIVSYIDDMLRIEEELEEIVDKDFCSICLNYVCVIKDGIDSFFDKLSPMLHRILERGTKQTLTKKIPIYFVILLKNISNFPSLSRNLCHLIKPYLKDWFSMYPGSRYFGNWMHILSSITWSIDTERAKILCSEAWPLFHPVLEVVKREFVGDKIVQDDCEYVLWFFSNLCCDPSHTVEVYDNVKDLLGGWFDAIKIKMHGSGIKFWGRLVSILSGVSTLIPHLAEYKIYFEIQFSITIDLQINSAVSIFVFCGTRGQKEVKISDVTVDCRGGFQRIYVEIPALREVEIALLFDSKEEAEFNLSEYDNTFLFHHISIDRMTSQELENRRIEERLKHLTEVERQSKVEKERFISIDEALAFEGSDYERIEFLEEVLFKYDKKLKCCQQKVKT
ncbi:hypothetical protein ADUPG1_012356, partial [Aduncisulcus paluster]